MDIFNDRNEAMHRMATTPFYQFTHMDWDLFAGCQSQHPMIAYDDDIVMIVTTRDDRPVLAVFGSDDEYATYYLDEAR